MISEFTFGYVSIFNIRCSIVVKALYYKPEGRGFYTRWGKFLILPNPGGYPASNRNEYQKRKNNNVSGE
jgi:hypothetical protein